MVRFVVSRIALTMALAGGAVAVLPSTVAFAKEKPPASGKFSAEYTKVAADLSKALADSSKNPAVTAAAAKAQVAKTPAEKQAAAAEVDAALGGAAAKITAASAVASTPTDKISLGQMVFNIGNLAADPVQQHRGLVMMLESGALPAADVGKLQYAVGATAYQSGDYVEAVKYLKPAYESGYRDQDNQIGPLLADVYKRTNNSGALMDMVNKDIATSRAAGTKPAEVTIRTALQAAYDAKNLAVASDLSAELARDYPSPESWSSAIGVVRALSQLPAQDNLDLMRLMARTNSLNDKRDYLEYLDNADPRRTPGETIKLIDQGVSAGKLTPREVAEYRQSATARLASDKASIPGLDRDAHASNASAITVSAAGDFFLSYDQPAKAEDIYKIALTKAGIDKNRVLTRLGIAQADQGKYADAQQTFAQVTGPRAPMAKLWTAYVTTKSGSGTTAPAPATPSQ